MCQHADVRSIAARSGEWWWCYDCGGLRDPEGRWFTSRRVARVLVAARDRPDVRPGKVTRVAAPPPTPPPIAPRIDPFTPQSS